MKLYIGENLRRLRLDRGLTQEALAERLGVSFQSVSRWETDQSYPDIEMIPEIALFFDVSTDQLMGVDKAMIEGRCLDDWRKACDLETDEERLEHYRNMHRRYPNDSMVLNALIDAIAKFPEYIDEQRRLTEEYLRMPDTGRTSRDVVISTLIASEEEDRLPDLLDEYSTRYDQMSRASLLATRFLKRDDEEKANRYFQVEFLEKLNSLSFGFVKSGRISGRDSYDRPLEMINMLTGTTGMSLVAGDGEPDLWFHERLMFGINLARDCFVEGDAETAYRHFEDTVSLFERFYSLPSGTTLTFRCPELSELKMTLIEDSCGPAFERADITLEESQKKFRCFRASELNFGVDLMFNDSKRRNLHMSYNPYHLYCAEYDIYPLIAKYGWEGFDSVRSEPRFVALVERMRKYIVEV